MSNGAIQYQQDQAQKRLALYNENPILCKQCNCILPYSPTYKNKKFCSNKCSASFNNIHRVRQKQLYPHLEKQCNQCGVSFCPFTSTIRLCSDACKQTKRKNRVLTDDGRHKLSMAGRRSVASRANSRRSKDEIALFELCLTRYPDASHNTIIVDGWDADIVIESQKICIMWNGPWHYKQLTIKNHSLLQVQNRDRIKLQKFLDLGWKVYVFEDRYFSPLTAFETII